MLKVPQCHRPAGAPEVVLWRVLEAAVPRPSLGTVYYEQSLCSCPSCHGVAGDRALLIPPTAGRASRAILMLAPALTKKQLGEPR